VRGINIVGPEHQSFAPVVQTVDPSDNPSGQHVENKEKSLGGNREDQDRSKVEDNFAQVAIVVWGRYCIKYILEV
jgi:hypothetical protein